MNTDTEREAFEAWCAENLTPSQQQAISEAAARGESISFAIWQAARASAPATEPGEGAARSQRMKHLADSYATAQGGGVALTDWPARRELFAEIDALCVRLDSPPPQAAAPAAVGEPQTLPITQQRLQEMLEEAFMEGSKKGIEVTVADLSKRGMLVAASPAPDRYEASRAQKLRDAGFTPRERLTGAGGLMRDKFKDDALGHSSGAVAEPPGASDGARGDGGVEPQGAGS